jgi:hypothetical protein
MADGKEIFNRAEQAFNQITGASYYGIEMMYQLARNPKALASLEEVIEALRNSAILSDAMDIDK